MTNFEIQVLAWLILITIGMAMICYILYLQMRLNRIFANTKEFHKQSEIPSQAEIDELRAEGGIEPGEWIQVYKDDNGKWIIKRN